MVQSAASHTVTCNVNGHYTRHTAYTIFDQEIMFNYSCYLFDQYTDWLSPPPPTPGRNIFGCVHLSVCLSGHPSGILDTEFSENNWGNIEETWWGYPLRMCKELVRFWAIWPNFQGHQGCKGEKGKAFICTQYTHKFFSHFDETLCHYALFTSDEGISFWGMWRNLQGPCA